MSDGYESAEVLTISSQDAAEEWILDSSCLFHMCPNRAQFILSTRLMEIRFYWGDNKACIMAGIGMIKSGLEDESERILLEVRYVLDLKRNLISLRVLNREGCSFKSQGEVLRVSRGPLLYMKGTLKGMLYVLHGKTLIAEVVVINY